MGLLFFLIDTIVSVHIKTHLSTVGEQRGSIPNWEKNWEEKENGYMYIQQKTKTTTKLTSAKKLFDMNMKFSMNLLSTSLFYIPVTNTVTHKHTKYTATEDREAVYCYQFSLLSPFWVFTVSALEGCVLQTSILHGFQLQ